MIDYNNALDQFFEPLHEKFYNENFTFLDLMLLTSGPIEYYYSESLFCSIVDSIAFKGVDFLNEEFSENPQRGSEISKTLIHRFKKILDAPKDEESLLKEFRITEADIERLNRSLRYVIYAFSELCPEFDHGIVFTAEDKKIHNELRTTDKRKKHFVLPKKKAYLVHQVFGKYMDDYLSKPLQIELLGLITGDSGNYIYNERKGKNLVPSDREELDKTISKYLKHMK